MEKFKFFPLFVNINCFIGASGYCVNNNNDNNKIITIITSFITVFIKSKNSNLCWIYCFFIDFYRWWLTVESIMTNRICFICGLNLCYVFRRLTVAFSIFYFQKGRRRKVANYRKESVKLKIKTEKTRKNCWKKLNLINFN